MSFILEIEENGSVFNKAVFLDFNLGEVYVLNADGNLIKSGEDIKKYVMETILNRQIELTPEVPEDLKNAMNTEKNLSEKNNNHIFRRREY